MGSHDTLTRDEQQRRAHWARQQADDAVTLRLARIAEAERALADARRRLAVAECELQARQKACDDF
jgi:hypothetical protein